ncbi:MAG: NusG domain II-containing protein [Treponema sp.]|nr:NusG domain II-containing protein [Treponema sp.]
MPLKLFDFAIIIPALGMVIASFLLVYGGNNGNPAVNLKSDGGEWVFPINAEETMVVSGPLGETSVVISGNSARITSSPCMNQVCVAAGLVSIPGQWAACLPNRVMLYIISETSGQNNVDAAAW